MSLPAGADPASPGGVDLILSMIRQVGSLADKVAFERSFKASAGRLSHDRFLLGIERTSPVDVLDAAIGTVCQAMAMPSATLDDFRRSLGSANHVYFGAERDGQRLTLKAYLEFRDEIDRSLAHGREDEGAYPLYVGYKWDAADRSRLAKAHYVWRPALSSEEILRRVMGIVAPAQNAALRELVATVTGRALDMLTPQALQLVDVREDGHARASFDIKVYRAGYRVRDLSPLLRDTFEQYAIPAAMSEPLLQRIGPERVGHLAAGIDREGRDFLTLYYGGVVVDGTRLRQASVVHRAASHEVKDA